MAQLRSNLDGGVAEKCMEKYEEIGEKLEKERGKFYSFVEERKGVGGW